MEKIQPKQLKFGKVERILKHILLMEKCWVTSARQSSPLHLAETHRQSMQLAICSRQLGCMYSQQQILCIKVYTLLYIHAA